MKKFIAIIVTAFYLNVFAQPVFADTQECSTSTGSYGQTSTTCKVLGETTTVTHVETVAAGFGDVNFGVLALILTIVSSGLFGASKLAQRIYWFD